MHTARPVLNNDFGAARFERLERGLEDGACPEAFNLERPEVLQEIDPSPLTGLARQTVANARNVLRVLARARRLGAAEVAKSFGEVFSSHWKVASESLVTTSQRYNAKYAAGIESKERTE